MCFSGLSLPSDGSTRPRYMYLETWCQGDTKVHYETTTNRGGDDSDLPLSLLGEFFFLKLAKLLGESYDPKMRGHSGKKIAPKSRNSCRRSGLAQGQFTQGQNVPIPGTK